MKLHELKNTPGAKKRRKIVGRGDGSGLGGTAGRGHKGEKARSGTQIRPFFEGGQIPFFRRLPKRGFKSRSHKLYNIVNLIQIENNFSAGETIDENILREKKLIGNKGTGLKVLGAGEITKPFTIKADKFSETAKSKIEAAGGKCEITSNKKQE